jgi:hypothetical protein
MLTQYLSTARVCVSPEERSRIVRITACLRPISIVADLAGVSEGLFIHHFGSILQEYWGPSQCGGVLEALVCVAAIVLLCQMRTALGLPAYLPFADIAAAFDGASRNEMLLGLFTAGVGGKAWMLIDDLMQHDECHLALDGVRSDIFSLPDGKAQGRKISARMFNCLMRKLHEVMESYTSGAQVGRSDGRAVCWTGQLRSKQQLNAPTAATPCVRSYHK